VLIPLLAHGVFGATAMAEEYTMLLQLDVDNAAGAHALQGVVDRRNVPGGFWEETASGKVCLEDTHTLHGSGSSLAQCKNAVASDPACGTYLMYEPFQQNCFCTLPSQTKCTFYSRSGLSFYSIHKYTPPSPKALATDRGQANASSSGVAEARGDPHMMNIYGQRFDLMRAGSHTLVHIPRNAKPVKTLFDVTVDVERTGSTCADMYIQSINVTGHWAASTPSGGRFYSVKRPQKNAGWQKVGRVSVKVIHGSTQDGTKYLNFLIRDLSKVATPIGGLLGEDDHTAASKPDPSCVHRTFL
jgi:hypothetical protein